VAVLATTGITLPRAQSNEMWAKAVTGSVVSVLSGQQPMQFGATDIMTFDTPPRAEYVAEGGNKASTSAAFGIRTVVPHKAQVTMRFNQEVLWADEDFQLGVLSTLANAGGVALARALDLGVIHRINPLTGTAAASITGKLNDTTQRVEVAGAADLEVETAAGAVIASGYIPNGVAFDPKYAWTLATARYSDGRKKFPELGYGTDISNFQGLQASVSSTVSGTPEATDTKLRGLVGDWTTVRWGVQHTVPVELIQFGDPDGQGDLKRTNQIALRLEIVYGWVFMDLNAFAAINDLV
jgi:hypothetical protein